MAFFLFSVESNFRNIGIALKCCNTIDFEIPTHNMILATYNARKVK